MVALEMTPRPIASIPKMTPEKPRPVKMKPRKSNRRLSGATLSSMNRLTRIMPAMPIGILIQKIQRQEA